MDCLLPVWPQERLQKRRGICPPELHVIVDRVEAQLVSIKLYDQRMNQPIGLVEVERLYEDRQAGSVLLPPDLRSDVIGGVVVVGQDARISELNSLAC